MKRNIFKELISDFWVIVLDAIAVNAAYLLTLLIRYYVQSEFVPEAIPYFSMYIKFSPYYTILCIIVFAIFKLYNGLWRYASVNDMNRIIIANLVTILLHVACTLLFFARFPKSYYMVGAAMQTVFILVIRYFYRVIEMEKKKISSRKYTSRNVMIIGSDVNSINLIKFLMNDAVYQPTVVVGTNCGKSFRGLPVIDNVEQGIKDYSIQCIFIANPLLPDKRREELRRICDDQNIELHDYSGFLKNQFGSLPLTSLTKVIPDGAQIKLNDQVFENIDEAMQTLTGRYKVIEITGEHLLIEIVPEHNPPAENWAETYKEETGEDVSFF